MGIEKFESLHPERREALGDWTIWPDQRVTRRKLFHIVTTPTGEVAFKSRLLHECVDYLDALEVTAYQLRWFPPDNPALGCQAVKLERLK